MRLPTLFPYAEVYPRDREDLVDKLHDLCTTASRLAPIVLEMAVDHPGVASAAYDVSARTPIAVYNPEDIKECLRRRDIGAMTSQYAIFPFEGFWFHIEKIDNYAGIGTLLLRTEISNPPAMSTHDYLRAKTNFIAEDKLQPGGQKRTAQRRATTPKGRSNCQFFASDTICELSLYQPIITNLDNHYDLMLINNDVIEWPGPPYVSLQARLNPHQSAILERYREYGLAYDQALAPLKLMQGLTG